MLTFLLTGLSSLCRSNLIFKLKKKSVLLHGRIALLVKTILVTQGSHGLEKSLNFSVTILERLVYVNESYICKWPSEWKSRKWSKPEEKHFYALFLSTEKLIKANRKDPIIWMSFCRMYSRITVEFGLKIVKWYLTHKLHTLTRVLLSSEGIKWSHSKILLTYIYITAGERHTVSKYHCPFNKKNYYSN